MFVYVNYRDPPELYLPSTVTPRHSQSDEDAAEKVVLVNVKCPIGIIFDYIRKVAKLGKDTEFDLCDKLGRPRGMFTLLPWSYATELFQARDIYYIVVRRLGKDGVQFVPQLLHDNPMYQIIRDNAYASEASSSAKSSSKGSKASKGSKGTRTSSSIGKGTTKSNKV